MADDKQNNKVFSRAILVFIIAIIPVGLLLPQRIGICWTWAIVAVLMLLIVRFISYSLGKGASGALIDPVTNTMSLSRLQIILWTWVILSAFVTIALARIADSCPHPDLYTCKPDTQTKCAEPINIQIPPLLWALMGISITSAVGSPLIKADKAQKTAAQDEASKKATTTTTSGLPTPVATFAAVLEKREKADPRIKDQVGDTKPLGAIFRKESWDKAMFSDMFTGEEVSTFGYINIAKVQNLLFTVVAVTAYAIALLGFMSENTKTIANLIAFPNVPEGLIAIIGISHGGYLADKAVTHSTPTT
jgi:hypothetical protein